jgi:hypothetical protein
MKALLLFAAAAASAASGGIKLEPATPTPAPAPAPQLVGAHTGNPYWFKTYSTAPYGEIWTGNLAIKDYAGRLPKALEAIKADGGVLDQPLGTFVSSPNSIQLSFSLPRKNVPALLKALRKLGDMPEPAKRVTGEPIPIKEVREKIDAMMKEKTDHAADLARVPAAAAAEEEILEHLLLVDEVAKRVDSEARFNLSVRQK